MTGVALDQAVRQALIRELVEETLAEYARAPDVAAAVLRDGFPGYDGMSDLSLLEAGLRFDIENVLGVSLASEKYRFLQAKTAGFRVTWAMELEASSAEEAAALAHEYQRTQRPLMPVSSFAVQSEQGVTVEVQLPQVACAAGTCGLRSVN
jgi:hypothetical protein